MRTKDYPSLAKGAAPPAILFVGDSTSFSDMYIRLIQSEFQDVDVKRATNLDDAHAAALFRGSDVEAIVLACRNGHDAVADIQAQLQQEPDLHLVLAYQSVSEARDLLGSIENRTFVERLSFLPLRTRMDCTVTILRLVLSGERHVSADIMDTLMAWKSASSSEAKNGATLTAREQEVLEHLAKGASNKLIARELELAESTVKLHIHHIIRKLGVSNRTEAAVAYVAGRTNLQITP